MNKMYLSIVMLSFVTLSPNTYALCTDFTNSYYYVENDQVSKHTAQAWSCANVNAYSAAYEFEDGSTLSIGIRFDLDNVETGKDDEIQGDWSVTLNSSRETINVEIPQKAFQFPKMGICNAIKRPHLLVLYIALII